MTPFDHVSFRMTQRHMPASEEGLRQLREAMERLSPNTLIADGEARNERLQDPSGPYGKWQADHLKELYGTAQAGLIDVLLMDVGAMSFTPWREVMPRLLALGAQGSPHAWSEPFKAYYTAQIGCAYGGVPIVEGVGRRRSWRPTPDSDLPRRHCPDVAAG